MEANAIVLDDTAGDVIVVVVEGEHDIYTAPTLRERLDEALSHGGGIVVDLTAATFVDSSVLGALLDARRRALAGMADALAFDASVLSDMKMAVTEACTNVVVHAYDEEAGQLEVEMLASAEDLTIVVRDHGAGIQPKPARTEPPALGLGLP